MINKIPYILILFFLITGCVFAQSVTFGPEYLQSIQQKINSYVVYPKQAETEGLGGIAKVKFTLNQDGQVKDIAIAESSGYPLLDEAAISAIKDASPYPFPTDLDREELELVVPINYAQGESESTQPQPETAQPALPEALTSAVQPAGPSAITPPMGALEPQPQELTSLIGLAIKNNHPTEIAREEIQLAQIKVTEAKRNLYPKLKLSGYNTTGQVFKVDYEEREIKTEIGQPLYYGGRLINTLNQAKVNLEITKRNYDRIKLDVMHRAETAYYNLVAAKMNLQKKEEIRQEAKDMLEKVEKLAQVEMIIPLEANSAKAWYRQIELQIESTKQDLSIAELTLKQILNSKEAPVIQTQDIEAKRLDLNLDNCLEIALKSRPEVYLSELLVKFNYYGKRIDESKGNKPTVDLVSSYGRYEGHFTTEPWKPADNWYLGFKGTVPWGANTLNSSYTDEATQPRFGQTSATKSSTFSSEFNLLDDLNRVSDKKRSNIDFKRSLSDLNETNKTIAFEVEDAYFNYQKAFLQLDTAQADMDFRRNEVEVMKVRSMTGEVNISAALEALFNLSEAQTKYLQALANCRIFLANLKKACGYGLPL